MVNSTVLVCKLTFIKQGIHKDRLEVDVVVKKYFTTFLFRVLEKEGIHCNMTLLFSFAQVILVK